MPENPDTEPQGSSAGPEDAAVGDDATISAAATAEMAPAPDEAALSGRTEPTGSEPAQSGAPTQSAPPAKAAAKAATSRRAVQSAAAGSEAPRTTRRKVREGIVVSNGMEKTAVVVVIERVRHPRYAKTVQRTKRLYAHDETNDVRVGDRVRLVETRPLSKLKRWRVERVLERAR
jgi:small subunit ribosomal protein S17